MSVWLRRAANLVEIKRQDMVEAIRRMTAASNTVGVLVAELRQQADAS